MKFIALNHCCAKGLDIVLNRDRAWERHDDAEAVRWRIVSETDYISSTSHLVDGMECT